ncbi:16S rRNA (uracil(1498)-N(3))-methyltransferase, partial [Candidatus Parcubacteria bacterium]|nr:16S rRNA (uracil(1498)-N(3))-methyltransferase [Candidatus Parcubacteria bacterium]
MKTHYFFIQKQIGNDPSVVIETKEILHQWKRVFRFGPEDRVVLLDNSGFEYWGTIKKITTDSALVSIDEKREGRMPKDLSLTIALPKKDKFEWILEKGTELGVSHFYPIVSDRSEKKDLNIERSEKIIKEAAEQSEHSVLPKISEVRTVEEALKNTRKKIV